MKHLVIIHWPAFARVVALPVVLPALAAIALLWALHDAYQRFFSSDAWRVCALAAFATALGMPTPRPRRRGDSPSNFIDPATH